MQSHLKYILIKDYSLSKVTYIVNADQENEWIQASDWYRAFVPAQELKSKKYDVSYCRANQAISKLPNSDIFVFIRINQLVDIWLVNTIKDNNRRIIIDLDDNPWVLPGNDSRILEWEKSGLRLVTDTCLPLADTLTVSTYELSNYLQSFNLNVNVLENCLPDSLWSNISHDYKNKPLVIGWAGSITHSEDLQLIVEPLLLLLSKHPSIELHLAGQFGNTLKNPFPKNDRIKLLNIVPIRHYQKLLKNFDIGIAPLIDNPFNRSKSDLKLLEYAGLGIPCVASAVIPYSLSIVHGETGFLAKDNKDWVYYLENLIENRELYQKISKASRIWSSGRMISANISKWENAYKISS